MICPTPKCGYDSMPDGSRFCPKCGEAVPEPSTQITIDQQVQSSSKTTGVYIDKLQGNVTNILQTFGTAPQAKQTYVPPATRHRLFGREQELAQIASALREHHTVLLHGMGGVGKTALAAKTAQQLYEERTFKDGILWVSEIGDASIIAICDAITRHLNDEEILKLAPQAKPDRTRGLLAAHDSLLLILDDVTVSETAETFVRVCLPQGMALLVTSRRRYLVFDVDVKVNPPDPDAARTLFRDRANMRDSAMAESDDALIGDICVLLENHPLALVIAAGRFRGEDMPLSCLHARLADEKERLHALKLHDSQDKNLNVWASLKLSYDDLHENQRRVFTCIAACFGDSTGLELLADIRGLSQVACEDYVGHLVARSLVTRKADRVSLHQLVRDFGRDALDAELPTVQDQVLEAVRAYTIRYGQNTPEHHDKLEAELDNALGAVRYASVRQAWPGVIDVVDPLSNRMLYVRGYWTELVQVGQLGMRAAKECGDEPALARLAHNTAVTVQDQGDYETAGRLYEQSLEIGKRLGDQAGIAGSLHQLGRIAQDQGDHETARRLYEQSLEISKRLGNQAGIAISLHQLGVLAQQQGDYETARRLYEQSLEIEKRLRDQEGIAGSLHQLGRIAQYQGSYETARRLYEQSLEIEKRLGDQAGIAGSLHQLGVLAQAQGEYETARRLYEQSLEIKKRLGNQAGIAISLHSLGTIAQEQSDYEKARRLYEQSLEIFERLKSPHAKTARKNLKSLP